MTKLSISVLICFFMYTAELMAEQMPLSSRQDTLRGAITEERSWWDLQHYQLRVAVDINERSFVGSNVITYKVVSPAKRLQLELQPPMKILSVTQNGQNLSIEKEGYSHFITLVDKQQIGQEYRLEVSFSGIPQEAENAPWDGGVTWSQDSSGTPLVATSNQGVGASIWWPNKDHGYDEPDRGIDMMIEVPQPLVCVANGRLINIEEVTANNSRIYHWQVKSPINNYGVNINIADYVGFSETYDGELGALAMDYYVFRENEDIAKVHFKDAVRAIQAMEYWFGPYPFYQDSFKLVEVPYLGMEHQSSITYGNGFKNGYKGTDLSESGWGLKWDYIIIHETAHEWFANSVTAQDIADLWIQEGFTTYAEGLFVEFFYGKTAAQEYIQGLRSKISNDKPMIAKYGVHQMGSRDVYVKGANVLHTLRQLFNDDDKWRQLLRGISRTFYHQTVTSKQIEDYISEFFGDNLASFFDQYLRDNRLPILEYKFQGITMSARWTNTIPGFEMPINAFISGEEQWYSLTTQWQSFEVANTKDFEWNRNFYVAAALLFNQAAKAN